MNTKNTVLPLAVIATLAIVTIAGTNAYAEAKYNPDMTDWWGDMIEALGDQPSMTFTEPGYDNDVYELIARVSADTYRIELYGITESGEPIVYTITVTETGYISYGPVMADGSMPSDTYVTSLNNDALASQPIKPPYIIVQDYRYGEGSLFASKKICYLAKGSWFSGTVTDDYDGSPMNWKANVDAYDNCKKLLYVDGCWATSCK